MVCCALGGYILWSRTKEPTETPNPTPNPVVTPNDDNQGNNSGEQTDVLNHPLASADKYTFVQDGTEYTLYLKAGSNNFYYLNNTGCVSGNYGTYTESEGSLTLQSEMYYDCSACYFTSADVNNSGNATLVLTFTKDTANNVLVSSDGMQTYTYVGAEEISNPFNAEGVHSCDNQENAN